MSTETAAPVAGADLDARIAVEVLGYTHRLEPGHDYYWLPPSEVYEYGVRVDEPPWYSRHIGAAWEVVEHLRTASGWIWWLTDSSYRREDLAQPPRWRAEAHHLDHGLVRCYADTLPLAICLVALQIVEDAR